MIDKLENVLNSEVKEQKQERNNFSNVYISNKALKKARMYAKLSRDNRGSPIECYGYLLGSLDKRKRIVEDVYYAPNQDGSSAHTMISGEQVILAGKEIREKFQKRIVGWWHSHANFQPFHSGTDDQNHKTVLDQIAPSNYINAYTEKEFLKDTIKKTKNGNSKVFVCDRNNNSKRLEIIFSELEENPLSRMPVEKLVLRMPSKISYAYSIVVNALGSKPHCEIATLKFCNLCPSEKYAASQFPLRVVDYDLDIELDKDKLAKEVDSKLIVPKYISFKQKMKQKRNSGRIIDNKVYVQTSGGVFVLAKTIKKKCKTGKKDIEKINKKQTDSTKREKKGLISEMIGKLLD